MNAAKALTNIDRGTIPKPCSMRIRQMPSASVALRTLWMSEYSSSRIPTDFPLLSQRVRRFRTWWQGMTKCFITPRTISQPERSLPIFDVFLRSAIPHPRLIMSHHVSSCLISHLPKLAGVFPQLCICEPARYPRQQQEAFVWSLGTGHHWHWRSPVLSCNGKRKPAAICHCGMSS